MHRAELVEQSRQTRGCPWSRSQNEVKGGYDDEGDEEDLIGSGNRQFGGGSLGQPSSEGATSTRHQRLENPPRPTGEEKNSRRRPFRTKDNYIHEDSAE